MPPADGFAHLNEFLLLLVSFIGPGTSPHDTVAAQDKTQALLLYAQKGDDSEYKKVLASIRFKKERTEQYLASRGRLIKRYEDTIQELTAQLNKAGDDAPRLQGRIDAAKGLMTTLQGLQPITRKQIEDRSREEEALTKVFRLVEKERKAGVTGATPLAQMLGQVAPLVAADLSASGPRPVPIVDKVKALRLLAQKKDSGEHKAVLAAIRSRKKEAEGLIGKNTQQIKDTKERIKADEGLLAKAAGDTAVQIRKRLEANRRTIKAQEDTLAALRQHLKDRDVEAAAWIELARIIARARPRVRTEP